jgi:hypothetical protein
MRSVCLLNWQKSPLWTHTHSHTHTHTLTLTHTHSHTHTHTHTHTHSHTHTLTHTHTHIYINSETSKPQQRLRCFQKHKLKDPKGKRRKKERKKEEASTGVNESAEFSVIFATRQRIVLRIRFSRSSQNKSHFTKFKKKTAILSSDVHLC